MGMREWEMPYDQGLVDDCPHGIGDPAWCSTCKHGPATVTADDIEREATITARFEGDCPSCDHPILDGQQITRWSDERWRHEGCEP